MGLSNADQKILNAYKVTMKGALKRILLQLEASQKTNVDEHFDELRKDRNFCLEADALRTKRWKEEFEKASRLQMNNDILEMALEMALKDKSDGTKKVRFTKGYWKRKAALFLEYKK